MNCCVGVSENNFLCDGREQLQTLGVKSHNSLAASAVRAHMYTFTCKHTHTHSLHIPLPILNSYGGNMLTSFFHPEPQIYRIVYKKVDLEKKNKNPESN